jgi:arylformamidase
MILQGCPPPGSRTRQVAPAHFDIISVPMARVPRFLDVSVPLAAGVPTYPGNPEFELQPIKRIANGDSSNVSRIVMGTHAATHVDAPKHFFDDGAGTDGLDLELLLGRARVVEITRRGGITAEDLMAAGLREDIRVLFKTPNSAYWNGGGGFRPDYTHVTESGARYLVDQGVKLVGVDYLSVEEFKKAGAPAHRALLSQGVIIIEGLNLSEAEPGMYELYCLPIRIAGADGAPARVVLKR